ncbi:MAG: DUF1688 family protein [Bacteriovoracaceae bacterium]|jgi:hypothetical protein|nr:uracil phosphoribosyltransferase [Halobacteriovoraceae bacterium]MDP7320135.1 DUF1688 family protein [Bacteriovoracaceae bacterium]
MNKIKIDDVDYLLSAQAVRQSTSKIYELAKNGKTHFSLNEEKVADCADYVLEVIKENYPTLEIPFHSRWNHFQVGGIDRLGELNHLLQDFDKKEQARIKLDLVVVSVLLDAGAGGKWSYEEENKRFNRSEGLAVASYHMFLEKKFSSQDKWEVDAVGLLNFTTDNLRQGFQVSEKNPLVGIEGRVKLLNKLGEVIQKNTEIFPGGRPSGILDYLMGKQGHSFEVEDILKAVLAGLGPIWPGRIFVEDINLGDVWHYPPLDKDIQKDSVICFHKLSQWLTYSLVGPMESAGLSITGAEKLTGLAEYRNGGLFLDFKVIDLKDKNLLEQEHLPSSELVIEWRALTIQLLDRLGTIIQAKLDKKAAEFPMVKVLEGGTWWAGRKIAKEKRADGSSPLKLKSDGTVF